MAEAFKLFRRQSLFTHIMVSVIIVAMLSLTAAVVGWRLLDQASGSIESVSQNTIPLVSAVQSMDVQTTGIVLITSNITLYKESKALDQVFARLERYLVLMEESVDRIKQHRPETATLKQIERVVGEIRLNLQSFRQLKYEQIKLQDISESTRSKAIAISNELDILLDQATEKYSDQIFEVSMPLSQLNNLDDMAHELKLLIRLNQDSDLLHRIRHDSIETHSLLEHFTTNLTPDEIKKTGTRINHKLRTMTGALTSLPDSGDTRKKLAHIKAIYRLVRQPGNIEQKWMDLYGAGLKLEEANGHLQSNVFELNQLSRKLVELTANSSRQNAEAAVLSAYRGKNILLVVSIVLLVLSVYVIWFIVLRKIVHPLRELTVSMRKLSMSEFDININQYSLIELNEMARSLEVFLGRSIALEEHQLSLQNSNLQLNRVNEDLSTFVHVASHELKSPLRGIRILSEFITVDIDNQKLDKAKENLKLMQTRISRIDRLLNSLLAYTSTGSSSEDVSPVVVRKIIQEAFDLVDGDGRFSLHIVDDIPLCKVVESDLTIIFLNLFDNAIMHHDSDRGNVRVLFRETADSYIFVVEDDGPGIEPEYHDLIFDVLKTLKSKDEIEGSGVGLSQVRRLLESRGGTISVTSNPSIERGTRFVIYYPKSD